MFYMRPESRSLALDGLRQTGKRYRKIRVGPMIRVSNFTHIRSAGVIIHHFFVDRQPGVPWPPENAPLYFGKATAEDVSVFVTDFAEQQIAISTIPFSGIGSLYPSSNGIGITLGPMISNSFGKTEPPWFYGPFTTNRERYLTHIRVNLDLIENHDLFDEDPVTAYLVQLEARSMVESCEELAREETEFFIKHADDKADQFLTKENRINSIIDWEW